MKIFLKVRRTEPIIETIFNKKKKVDVFTKLICIVTLFCIGMPNGI